MINSLIKEVNSGTNYWNGDRIRPLFDLSHDSIVY